MDRSVCVSSITMTSLLHLHIREQVCSAELAMEQLRRSMKKKQAKEVGQLLVSGMRTFVFVFMFSSSVIPFPVPAPLSVPQSSVVVSNAHDFGAFFSFFWVDHLSRKRIRRHQVK